MKGIERDLLKMSVDALKGAYEGLNSMKCDMAAGYVSGGKSDTYGLDWMPESIIKHKISDYDANIVLITEETGKMHSGKKGIGPTQTVFVCDPTDRSIKLHEFITAMMDREPSYRSREVHDVIGENLEEWQNRIGNPSISGASASMTVIRDRIVLFSVMVNYVTGEIFVANSIGTKYGNMEEDTDITKMNDLEFPANQPKNHSFATFLKKPGYPENLQKCSLGLKEEDCIDPWAPGPMRILYLSSLNSGNESVSFILSNGEKIGEWLPWLPWIKYARDPVESDEHALEAYRIFFDDPRTKELVLVAPAPHYSIFTEEDGETKINLDRMFQLDDPSHYRETLLVTPRHNFDAIGRVTSLGKYQQKMKL